MNFEMMSQLKSCSFFFFASFFSLHLFFSLAKYAVLGQANPLRIAKKKPTSWLCRCLEATERKFAGGKKMRWLKNSNANEKKQIKSTKEQKEKPKYKNKRTFGKGLIMMCAHLRTPNESHPRSTIVRFTSDNIFMEIIDRINRKCAFFALH